MATSKQKTTQLQQSDIQKQKLAEERKRQEENEEKTLQANQTYQADVEDALFDKDGKRYTKDNLITGISRFTQFLSGSGDWDSGGAGQMGGSIGGGSRAEVARALGFSDHPTESETSAAMQTISIAAYPGRKITVHKKLVAEVQQIFNELKAAGVNLNKNIGGYCHRTINNPKHPNSPTLSMHSFGCAIDINYDLNGFVGGGKPLTSGDNTPAGIMRTVNSPIVQAFARHGWGWGGRYGDYMHFSKANGG